MKWVNHIAIAASATAVWRPELIPVAVAGSIAPDWMESVPALVGGRKPAHRTVTHIVAYWVLALGFSVLVWDFHGMVAAFALGGLSHVLCDSLTVMGVPLVWWSPQRSTFFGAPFKTGKPGEYIFTAAIVAACLGLSLLTRSWGGGEFAPFFYDYADLYKRGVIDAQEWKENRFRWL